MRTAILFLLLPTLTFAQTNVSGFISANTTWTLAGSPYTVTGNTLVSHGYTLTIEPKVVVKFDTDKVLQIDGELIAIGTKKDRITFTSMQINPVPGDWGKIQFSDTSVDAVFDTNRKYVSGSIMRYCDVLYGGGIGFGELHLSSSSPYITNCKIAYSSTDGIYSFQKNFFIDSSVIKNCLNYGISFNDLPHDDSKIFIYADTIESNSKCGVWIGGSNQAITVINCSFISNHIQGALYCQYGINEGGLITNNDFIGNSANTIYGNIVRLSGYNFVVSCNRFINNQTTGGTTLQLGVFSENYIVNNIFQGNTSTQGSAVMQFGSGQPVSPSSRTYIMNNYVSNNSSPARSCIEINGAYNPANSVFSDIYIRNNDFINNSSPSFITLQTINQNPVASNNFIHLRQNNFLNPQCQYEIDNTIPFSSPNVDADSNYWGGNSTAHVDSAIHDFFDYGNISVVFYSPILSAPTMRDTICPSITIILPTSIEANEEPKEKVNARVFPNPFSTQLTFAIADNEQTTVSLYDFLGQQLLQQSFTNSTTINTEQLADGIYFYELRCDKGTLKTGKLVKQ